MPKLDKPDDPNPDAPWEKYARADFTRWLPGMAPAKVEPDPPPNVEIVRDGVTFFVVKSIHKCRQFCAGGRPCLTWGDVTRIQRTHPPGQPISMEHLKALLAASIALNARVLEHRHIDD